ncbi:uncharacterized protein LOC131079962 isoform X2 [Cryptomeria japonica]|uniref:uncharacterized protein LOC131079962 isoform X2 n=1 Tax=Cryptomeria japonica TaxID=3369 RepID=UPI0027DAA928|nr:uncharacterized protein LOC131079962 isoform X2 [Cryptomeria japonica]
MALHRTSKALDTVSDVKDDSTSQNRSTASSPGQMYSHLLLLTAFLSIGIIALAISTSITGFGSSAGDTRSEILHVSSSGLIASNRPSRYLYWGDKIDCPGKHCEACEGLGHQESSLRCALEEAMLLKRWASNSCAMDSLYDLDLISKTVPTILDNSKEWNQAISLASKSGDAGLVHVQGIDRSQVRDSSFYRDALIINRTASPLSWFVECKDRNNHSAVTLPYSFLPSMASKPLRNAAKQIRNILGDYDAMHVRRGDKIKIRKDRLGVNRTLHPHLDRDTHPEAILRRIEKWIPEGRTIFIASNERTPGFFSSLSVKYRLAYSSNFTNILEPVVQNNYHLFMLERLVLVGARTLIKTFKEEPTDLSLTDDPKKNMKEWQIPVYTFDDASPF